MEPKSSVPGLPKRARGGRPAIEITPQLLAKVEKLGASGISQKWAAQALMMSEDTFILKKHANKDFSDAWDRGKAIFAAEISEAAPFIVRGLMVNAMTKTESAPGGSVAAQLGFIEKVLRRPDGEETKGLASLEEFVGDSSPVEIQEVRFRRIRKGADKGRIEDDFDGNA